MKGFYIKVNINMEAIDCLRKCGKKGGEEEKQTFRCKLWIVTITQGAKGSESRKVDIKTKDCRDERVTRWFSVWESLCRRL